MSPRAGGGNCITHNRRQAHRVDAEIGTTLGNPMDLIHDIFRATIDYVSSAHALSHF
ncbi:hypothetical protein D3C84_1244190 [compost metagenome]